MLPFSLRRTTRPSFKSAGAASTRSTWTEWNRSTWALGVQFGTFCWDIAFDVSEGAYAEYAVASCSPMSLIPLSLSFMPSGAIPTTGLTALQMFRNTGSFLVSSSSVAIVSGQGGSGSHVLPRFACGITGGMTAPWSQLIVEYMHQPLRCPHRMF